MSTAVVLQSDEGAGQVPARVSRLGLLRPLASPSDILAVQEETRAFLAAALVEGRDYGKFPGVDKKSLFKAGAERSCLAFGLLSRFRIIEKEIDHDRPVPWRKVKAKYEGPRGNRVKVGEDITEGASLGLYRYVIECELLGRDSGEIVGSAIASCSTLESKYIDRPRDAENTVLQMAEKRAFVAATRTALGLSEQFTQDIEDDPDRFAKAEGVVDDDAVKCPKCQGAMWDNRAKNDEREKDGKKRMPDYKCKDRQCEAVIWSAQEFADELAKNDAVAGGKAAAPAAQGTPGGSATSPATSSSPATPTANKEESLEELVARAKRVSLMGRADSWDNHGGKPLGDCPDKVLKAAQNFFRHKLKEGSTNVRFEEQLQYIGLVLADREANSAQESLGLTATRTTPTPATVETVAPVPASAGTTAERALAAHGRGEGALPPRAWTPGNDPFPGALVDDVDDLPF
jgi:hypothetical protein